MNNLSIQDPFVPMYNIKVISRLTNLLPVTLRAWERRYGFPRPTRGNQGYRLYSEHDLQTIHWLKEQVNNGLSISRAAEYLAQLQKIGSDPVLLSPNPGKSASSPNDIAQKLFQHLNKMDEKQVKILIERVSIHMSIEQLLDEVIQPALVQIGDAWHRGELSISVEHFSTQLIVQTLHRWINQTPPPHHPGLVIAACAPGEQHQVGILTLVLLLRQNGWDVRFLGPDLSMEGIGYTLSLLQPRMILLSATRTESAIRVRELFVELDNIPEPKPLVLLGGQGFTYADLPENLPAVINQLPLKEAVQKIEKLLVR